MIMKPDAGKQHKPGGVLGEHRIVWLTNSILAVLARADSAEAGTALMLAVIASAHWRTSDATTRLRAVDEFAQQVRELAQREDTIARIEDSITWALEVERS
jgi:acyl-CoA reductase-like NAD-dependent aldehyde dehydrogenase